MTLDWSGASTPMDGFKTGAIVGLCVWGGADFIFYASTNLSDLVATLADPALEIIRFGTTGVILTMVTGAMGGGSDAAD